MSQDVTISLDQWRSSSPDDLSLVNAYSKFSFHDNGTMRLKIRGADHTVLSDKFYQKLNNDLTPLWGYVYMILLN